MYDTSGRRTGVRFGALRLLLAPLYLVALGVAEIVRLLRRLGTLALERWRDHRDWRRTRQPAAVPLISRHPDGHEARGPSQRRKRRF